MNTWSILLGPLTVWAVHFFGFYLVIEFAPSFSIPAIIVLTLAAIAANAALYRRGLTASRLTQTVSTGSALLSTAAVAWQSLPVILQ